MHPISLSTNLTDRAERQAVCALLAQGLERPTAAWAAMFERVAACPTGGEQAAIGWRIGAAEEPTGVLLALPCIEGVTVRDGGPPRVNLSSWVVQPTARARAPFMFRQATLRTDCVYTDLTPSPAVARLLPAVGFTPISRGTCRLLTAHVALQARKGWRIVSAAATLAATADTTLVRALRDHERMGCMVAGIAHEHAIAPVVLRRRWRKRVIPVAEVLFWPAPSADMAEPLDALPALSAWLIARGLSFLEIERPLERELTVPHRVANEAPRYAKGAYDRGGIDHLYSELVYMGA